MKSLNEPTERVKHFVSFALDHSGDNAGLIKLLRDYEADIKAAAGLGGDGADAANCLLELLHSSKTTQSEAQVAAEAAHYLRAILSSVQPQWPHLVPMSVVVGGLILAVSSYFWGNAKHIQFFHVLQAMIIVGFILWHWRWLKTQNVQGEVAADTFGQFKKSWMIMWFAWLLLYAWLALHSRIFPGLPQPWAEWITDVINTTSALAIWRCFLALDVPSVNLQRDKKRSRNFDIAFAVAAVVGCLCVGFAWFNRVPNPFWSDGIFGIVLVGIYSGLALSSLTSRFGSHFFGLPRWVFPFLYLYSSVQIFYSFLHRLPKWETPVYLTALVLKITLSWIVITTLRDGGFVKYLEAAQSGLLNQNLIYSRRWEAVRRAAAGDL